MCWLPEKDISFSSDEQCLHKVHQHVHIISLLLSDVKKNSENLRKVVPKLTRFFDLGVPYILPTSLLFQSYRVDFQGAPKTLDTLREYTGTQPIFHLSHV